MTHGTMTKSRLRIHKRYTAVTGGSVFLLMVVYLAWGWDALMIKIVGWQQAFHTLLTKHMASVASEPSTYGWSLVAISFAYGVFHAIGPGHGKAVISTYLATHPETLKRGMFISMSSALLQSVVAICLVAFLAKTLAFKLSDVRDYGDQLTLVSYVLVLLLGFFLAITALIKLARFYRFTGASGHTHDDRDTHDHTDHQNGHCSCNHAHVANQNDHWSKTLAVVVSCGIRPCSGAIVVLIYAHLIGLFSFGILATFSMGLGTGLAVCIIALATQYARKGLEALLNQSGSNVTTARKLEVGFLVFRLLGGVTLLILGWSLYQVTAAIALEHPLL